MTISDESQTNGLLIVTGMLVVSYAALLWWLLQSKVAPPTEKKKLVDNRRVLLTRYKRSTVRLCHKHLQGTLKQGEMAILDKDGCTTCKKENKK